MSTLSRLRIMLEWLPLLSAPVLAWLLTDGFTKSLEEAAWAGLLFLVLAQVILLALFRFDRGKSAFVKQYPAYGKKR